MVVGGEGVEVEKGREETDEEKGGKRGKKTWEDRLVERQHEL